MGLGMLVDLDVLFVAEVVIVQSVRDMEFHSKIPKKKVTEANPNLTGWIGGKRMARGNWRNWEGEVNCSNPECKNIIYKKYGIKKDGKYYCLSCIREMNRGKSGANHE